MRADRWAKPIKRVSIQAVMALILVLLTPIPLRGQSESRTLDRIAREQQNIRVRMDNISKKMERLIRKNELEGKEETAALIRRAQEEVKDRNLIKRIEDLDAKIRASQLTVDEEQRLLLQDLEDVFAILQDRSDLERLKEAIDAYRDGLQKISRFVEDQDRILEETRKLVYNQEATLRASLEKVSEILEGQRDLNDRANENPSTEDSNESWSSLAEKLEELAAAEEALAERIDPEDGPLEGRDRSQAEQEQGEMLKQAETLGEALENMSRSVGPSEPRDRGLKEAAAKASEKVTEALGKMQEAAQALAGNRPSQSAEQADEAARSLRESAETLNRAGEEAHRQERERERSMAGQQDMLREQMNDLLDKLNRLEDLQKDPSSDNPDAARKGREVLSEMESARDQLMAGKPDQARPSQAQAAQGLESLKKMLEDEQSAGEATESSGSPSLDPQREERLKELSAEQKALEEKVRDLMRRLRELPRQQTLRDLSNAADNMSGAAQELERGSGEEAEVEEEEAKKYLEKARKEMLAEEQKYKNIRQQEVLFRVQEALERLKSDQDKIKLDTVEFDLSREPGQRVNRRQRKAMQQLAQREQGIRNRTDETSEKIREDESTVFSWVLDRNLEDLDEVIDALHSRQSGPLVQAIQDDISDRFGELIDTLKQEMQRRNEASTEEPKPGESPPEDQTNALIPPVAELLMIKKMEENALKRLETFIRLNPELQQREPEAMERLMLERLGHRHASVTELFEKMLEKAQAAQGGENR